MILRHKAINLLLLLGVSCLFPSCCFGNIDATNSCFFGENTGWISAVSNADGLTVHFNGTDGFLDGLAWGENIGWIKFGSSGGGPYSNISTDDWGVNMAPSGWLSGYAWGENIGWIKFDPSGGGVSIDLSTGRFSGTAWGENIGWISFQGLTPNYGLRTVAFDRQVHGTPNWWLEEYGISEDYEDGDNVPAWQEYVADTDPTDSGSVFQIESIFRENSSSKIYFLSSIRRLYTLMGCDSLTSGLWTDVPEQTDIPGSGGLQYLEHHSNTNGILFFRVLVREPL